VLQYRFGEGAEDHARLAEPLLERRRHGHAVEHRIHCHAGQAGALVQGNAELVISFQQLGIHFLQALRPIGLGLGRRIIGDGLVVDGRDAQVRPVRLAHGQPMAEGLQAPFQHELGFVLLARDQPDHVLVEAGRYRVGFDIRDETVPVLLSDEGFQGGVGLRITGHD
jgi:hypothetical protein